MNAKHLLCALIAAGSANVAMADSGTITFTGQVVSATCTTVVNGAASPTQIILPTVLTGALGASGNVAGNTPFTLVASGCDASAQVRGIHYTLTPGGYTGAGNHLISNSGSASNVGIEILDGSAISFGGAPKQSTTVSITGSVAPSNDGTGTLSLSAQYKATGVATAGSVVGTLDWTLVYN